MTQLQKTASTCILRNAPVHGNFLFVVGSLEKVRGIRRCNTINTQPCY